MVVAQLEPAQGEVVLRVEEGVDALRLAPARLQASVGRPEGGEHGERRGADVHPCEVCAQHREPRPARANPRRVARVALHLVAADVVAAHVGWQLRRLPPRVDLLGGARRRVCEQLERRAQAPVDDGVHDGLGDEGRHGAQPVDWHARCVAPQHVVPDLQRVAVRRGVAEGVDPIEVGQALPHGGGERVAAVLDPRRAGPADECADELEPEDLTALRLQDPLGDAPGAPQRVEGTDLGEVGAQVAVLESVAAQDLHALVELLARRAHGGVVCHADDAQLGALLVRAVE